MASVVGTLLPSGPSTLSGSGPGAKSGPCCMSHRHPRMNNLLSSPLLCLPLPPKDSKGLLPKGPFPHALCFFVWETSWLQPGNLSLSLLQALWTHSNPFPIQNSSVLHTPQVSTSPQPIQKEEQFRTLMIWKFVVKFKLNWTTALKKGFWYLNSQCKHELELESIQAERRNGS